MSKWENTIRNQEMNDEQARILPKRGTVLPAL